ncbi:MAG: GldG family protein [Oligoflexia bacterium]|nr:GldG family protein [Oligoflexia bacterium]
MKMLSNILLITSFLLFCLGLVLWVGGTETLVYGGVWAACIASLFGWVFLNRQACLDFFTKKSTYSGANLGFSIVLVLAILTFINILGVDYHWRKDISFSQENSLSQQTVQVLGSLPSDIKVYYFNDLAEKERKEPIFKNYQYYTKKIQYEFVDTKKRPTFVKTMGVNKNDTTIFVLEGTNKKVSVDGSSEEKLTNGLLKLLKAKEQIVYFIVGHKERSIESSEALGFSVLKSELEKQGFTAKELSILSTGKIPDDAASIVVAGPESAFFPKEIEILNSWINEGGSALFALDLNPVDNGLAKGSKQIAEMLVPFGISVQSRMLVDPMSKAANVEPQVLLGFSGSKTHPISKDFAFSNIAANFLFPLSTFIQIVPNEQFELTAIVKTSPNAWAESDWNSLKQGVVTFNQNSDYRGQMDLAVAVEQKTSSESSDTKHQKKARVVVFSTSTFASNTMIDKIGNRDLFINSLAWLVGDESAITIRPKEDGAETILQANGNVVSVVLLITVFLVPLIIVTIGVVVWWRRSKR